MIIRDAASVMVCLAITSAACAADDSTSSKPRTAQVVTLARLAAVLCPDVEVDEDAVHDLMGGAGITDRDVVHSGAFGSADTLVARSFAQSFVADPADACSKLFFALGPGGGRLLHRAGKPV